jgi:Zn-dependent membrane protease YugP
MAVFFALVSLPFVFDPSSMRSTPFKPGGITHEGKMP